MKLVLPSFVAATACLLSFAAAAQTVQIPRPVPYAEDNDIADAIKSECKINEQLADFVKQYSTVPVEFGDASATSKGRVLKLQIDDAVSMGNAWMGHQKFTKVSGTLYDHGTKVAAFKARRNSMGGAFAGFKGSCAVLGRTVETIGKDVGGWLANPVDGAHLGD